MKGPYAIVDVNSFYASCEKVFKPSIWHKPVVVLSNNDGIIIALSKEAKDRGIKMGDPFFKVKPILKKHDVQVFSSNYALYGDMSQRVMTTLEQFSPNVEIYSIDEAFMDLNGVIIQKPMAEFLKEVKDTVFKWTGLPVSIGSAPTKTLSKIANKFAKKHKECGGILDLCGLKDYSDYLKQTPVSDIWGVGRQYAKLLNRHGIFNAWELSRANDKWIKKNMTVMGLRTVYELRGIPCIEMEYTPSPKKAIISSRSFSKPVGTFVEVKEAVSLFTSRAAEKMRLQKSAATELSVFLRTNPFKDTPQYHNGVFARLPVPTDSTAELLEYADKAARQVYREGFLFQKAGIMLAGFVPMDHSQLAMFDSKDRIKMNRLTEVMDQVNMEMGSGTLFYAASGIKRDWHMKREMKSPHYTTRWNDIPEVSAAEQSGLWD
ncbi:MAG: Y-family DNA polymerase [Candidatus Kapaibacterium sp.]